MILAKVPESETKTMESGSNKVPALIPFEEHQRLIDEAAKRASRETLDSFRKLERESREHSREDSGLEGDSDDDGGEIDFFATKTNKSIKNMVSSVATLKRAFEQPPSKIEDMLYSAFTQNVVQKLSGDGINTKKNWYDEILSSFAHGLGARGPEFIESLTRNFGTDWVKQTATGLLNPGAVINQGGYGGGQGQGGMSQSQGVRDVGGKSDLNQDAVDQIMALDPNNPSHVSAYAEIQGNIDINDARKMLMIHQDIFMNKMKRNAVQQTIDVDNARDIRVSSSVSPNVPVNSSVNSDIPPVWAQSLINKIMELENKVNQVYAGGGIGNVETIESVRTVSHVDSNIGKVQTAAEFQMELEEELRRDKEKLDNKVDRNIGGNVNKWEDDPGTAVGVVSHKRRLEEEQMRKRPVYDASADMIRREVEIQQEKLEITTVENFEEEKEEKVEIPADINSDVDKIVATEEVKEEEVKEEEKKEEEEKNNIKSTNIVLIPENETKGKIDVYKKAPKSVIDEPKEEVKSYQKGSQGWLKAQKNKKGV